MSKVFISYRHEDGGEAAKILDSMLTRIGFETIRDSCFACGDNLDAAVLKGLANSDLVILLVTPKWADGTWVQRELRYVRSVGKKAIHVLVGSDEALETVRDSGAFPEVWSSDDPAYENYLEYFPWLSKKIDTISQLDRTVLPILQACERVPIVDWPRSEQFLPLSEDSNKFICVTEKGLADAAHWKTSGNICVVTPSSRRFDLLGWNSTKLCEHFQLQPNNLTLDQYDEASRAQANGYGKVGTLPDQEGRDIFLVAATAFKSHYEHETSESLQRRAIRHSLEIATKAYKCDTVVMPMFATGKNVKLPVHQASRAVLSELACFMWNHKEPLAVMLSIPTDIQHALQYMPYLAGADIRQRLRTSIRFRLMRKGMLGAPTWISRSGTVRQLANKLLSPDEASKANLRCHALAGRNKVTPRGPDNEPYSYGLDVKIEDMVFADGEIVEFEADGVPIG